MSPWPYDLAETYRTDPVLQETVIRSSTWFNIANYVKLDESKLTDLISNVDMAGPGASVTETTSVQATPIGKPGE